MAIKHRQRLHHIAQWVATSPELDGCDDVLMNIVWQKHRHILEKGDLALIVDTLVRSLREMVKLDAIEARCAANPRESRIPWVARKRAKKPAAPLPLFETKPKGDHA